MLRLPRPKTTPEFSSPPLRRSCVQGCPIEPGVLLRKRRRARVALFCLVGVFSVVAPREPGLGDGPSGSVTAQPGQPIPVVLVHVGVRVQREPRSKLIWQDEACVMVRSPAELATRGSCARGVYNYAQLHHWFRAVAAPFLIVLHRRAGLKKVELRT